MDITLTTNTLSCETTPLLELHSNDQRQTTRLPQTRSFSCPVICIMFAQFCMDTTFFFIICSLALFAHRKEFLDLTPTEASTVTSMFFGTKSIIHVLGCWLADSKLGKFSVILYGMCICLIGTVSLLVCLSTMTNIASKRVFYMIGIIFVAVGQGMATLNNVIFAAEQLPNSATVHSLYYCLYGLINLSIILNGTFFVFIQDSSIYAHGHFVPFCTVLLALVAFLAAKPFYIVHPPYGNSVFSQILKVRKEAIRNSRNSRRSSISHSYPDHWLDRAKTHFGGSFSSWEVEDIKKIYRLLPIFATLMLNFPVANQMASTMTYQGEHMNIDFALGFRFPIVLAITFPVVLSVIAVLLLIPLIHKVLCPFLAKLHIYPSHLLSIGIGMLFSVASMACAGGVELYRVAECCIEQDRWGGNLTSVSNTTIFLQVPQYVLAGFGAVFTSFTAFDFILIETPKYLHGFLISVFWCILGFGWIASGVLVVAVNAVTEGNEWYPHEDQINNGKLAYYFFLLAALMFLLFILYVKVALSFKAKKESANLQITENTSTSYRHPRNPSRSVSNNLVFAHV